MDERFSLPKHYFRGRRLVLKMTSNIITYILNIMATIYKVEIVSHWSSYTKEQLQKILEDAVKQKERDKGNTMTIEVTERK